MRVSWNLVRRAVALALPLAIVATFVTTSPASAAATVTAGASVQTDGTGPFDGAAGPGNDTGATNGTVRTFDFVTYAVTIGNSGMGNDITNTTVASSLPVGMVWSSLDPTCRTSGVTPTSSISADRRTITCNIGNRIAGSLVEVPLVAYPLGTVPHGTTKNVDFTVAYNDPSLSNQRITVEGGSAAVVVSAGKNPDLSHNDAVSPVFGQTFSPDYTFGLASSTIGGTVTNGGAPLGGATVALFDSADDPVLQPGGSVPFTATTDGAGTYTFAGVPAGTVRTRVTAGVPAGKVAVGPTSYLQTVQGQALTNNHFDFVTPAAGAGTATISGTLFDDLNVNRVNNSEPGVDRVTLTLTGFDHAGTPVSRTVDTAGDGTYSFSVPPSGPNGYRIVASGRKVAHYLPVVTNEYVIHVGDSQSKTVDIAWSTDRNRGKLIVTRFPIALKAPGGGKGVSSMSGPITWQESVPAGATMDSCGRVGQNGTTFTFLPGAVGGGTNSVPHSGTWTCTQPGGPGTPLTVTVNGADTSGTTFPTRNQANGTLPADARYLAVGYVAISQPDPGCGVAIPAKTVSSSAFSATDIGGNPLSDAHPSTDTQTSGALSSRDCTPLPGQAGYAGFEKYFTKDESHGWTWASNESWSGSNLHNTNGNTMLPATAPFGSSIAASNGSTLWDATNYTVCDKFDNTRFKLLNRSGVTPSTPFKLEVTNPQAPFQNRLLRQYASTAAYDAAAADSGAFIVEFGVGTPYSSLAAQQSASCNEPVTWHAWDPAAPISQATLDGAIVFRLRVKAMQPSDHIRVRAAMVAKPTPPGTYAGAGLSPVPNPDPTLANTLGSYVSWADGSNYAQPNFYTRYADPGKGIVRINKYDSAYSASTTLTNAISGDTVGQTLYVTANGVYPNSNQTMSDVQVVDTLPDGLSYVPGSANITPTSVMAGPGGTTVISWNVGSLQTDTGTATITYNALVSPDNTTGTTLTNTAVVSSPDDPSPVGVRTDTHQLALTTAAEVKIFKETPDPRVEPEDGLHYRLGYRNLRPTALTTQDIIDVLPYVGDGRTTAFGGTYRLNPNVAAPIVANSAGDSIYVTTAAPASINRDPRHASNTLPSSGATAWCLVPGDLGNAGCPTSVTDPAISAFRVTSTDPMPNGAPTRFIDVRLQPSGDAVGNLFGNNFSATGGGLATYTQSNVVAIDVQRGSVSNLVWHDLNNNGRQDGGEPGLAGVPVTLTGRDYQWDGDSYELLHDYDASPLTTTTNVSGNYTFAGLNHGTFKVTFPTATAGLSLTRRDNATDTTDSDPNPATGETVEFCLGEAPHSPGSGTCTDYTGLASDQDHWDAGYTGTGSIGDFVWRDTNGDGVQNSGEPGLAGWTVELIGAGTDGLIDTTDDAVVATTTTDGSGGYGFANRPPGEYRVQITPASGWVGTNRFGAGSTIDSDVDPASNRINANVVSGSTNNSYDAGYYQPTGFGDRVWADDDADGIQDGGEAGLAAVRVDLLDFSNNPVNNSLGQPVFTFTDSSGNYQFTNLRPGIYRVRFNKPFGYSLTTQRSNGGSNGAGAANDSDPARTGIAQVTIFSGDPFLADLDAGMFKPATIGDKVWADTNRNGVQEPGEPGLASVTVALLDQNGDAVLNPSGTAYTTTTDASGRFAFTDLFPRTSSDPAVYYRVRFNLPAGYKWTGSGPITAPDQPSIPATGPGLTDSDTTWTTRTQSTATSGALHVGQSDTNDTVDAGMYRPATIGDFVWRDDDADGIQDSAEPGVQDVVVSLFQRTGAGPDSTLGTPDDVFSPALDDDGNAVPTATTTATGLYQFTNLQSGTYRVRFDWPGSAHVVPTINDVAGNAIDGSDSDVTATSTPRRAESGQVSVVYGNEYVELDAGFVPTSSVGDRVWEDVDGDGTQDSGEPGVTGAEVTLWTAGPDSTFGTGDDVQVVQDANGVGFGTAGTITTGSTGAYAFEDLSPGTYQVRVRTPGPQWRPTTRRNPSSPVLASDDSDAGVLAADGRTTALGQVSLAPLDRPTKVDAGLVRSSSIGDIVWSDTDGDGTQDAGEPGVSGAGMTLWTAGTDMTFGTGDDVQVTTDADGTTFGSAGIVTTASNGAYAFANVRPDTYQVRITAPVSTVLTRTDVGGDDAVDSDATRVTPSTGRLTPRVVPSNSTITDLDAGVYVPVTIGDRVWVDQDGDGVQDAGEPGLAGATVTLLDGSNAAVTTNAQGNSISAVTTASNGIYTFGDLPPGTYKAQVGLPAGYLHAAVDAGSDDTVDSDIDAGTNRSPARTLASGAVDNSVDAGAYRAITLGNRVWEDSDADGVQDAGETTGIPGVSVELLSGSTVIASTTTDAAGNYGFSRLGSNQADSGATLLPPGNYRVRFHRPTNWAPSPSSGVTTAVGDDSDVVFPSSTAISADTLGFDLAENANEVDIDAGFFRPGRVGDRIWEDVNGDGDQDAGEPGLAGVTVTLVDQDGNPVNDVAGNPVANIVTNSSGAYQFSNLRPGSYRVLIDFDESVWVVSTRDRGGNDAADSDFAGNGLGDLLTVVSGTDVTSNDAGLYHTIILGDLVFEDRNGNGIRNNGEPGVASVPVVLDGIDGFGNAVHRTTTSDHVGAYEFRDLAPGTYHVTVQPSSGWSVTPKDRGSDDTVDSDADPSTMRTDDTVLTSDEVDRTWDVGLIAAPLVSGHVYIDLDNDGVRDAGEPGRAGVTITLTGTGSLGQPITRTTTTDSTGTYVFANLPTSDIVGYTVTETQPSGLLDGRDAVGTGGGSTSTNDAVAGIVVVSGTLSEHNDFGELRTSSISGIAYVDTTANDTIDSGEPRLDSITVTLTGTDDLGAAVSTTATTGADGTFRFDTLRPGTYAVSATQASGYADGAERTGSAGGSTTTNDTIGAILLRQGTNAIDYLFGERPNTPVAYTSLEGTVWRDPNRNGAHDAGETGGVSGATIALKRTDGSTAATTVTDINGHYAFVGFPTGNYWVEQTQPSGWASTSPNTLGSTGSPLAVPPGGLRNQDFFEDRGRIAGSVYSDDDNDGLRDEGEAGVSGVTVTLTGIDVDGNTVNRSATTSANGAYRFADLPASDPSGYTVAESQPSGWNDGLDRAGTVDGAGTGTVANDSLGGIVLPVGGDGAGYDFGEIRPSGSPGTTFVSGHVYLDSDRDGQLDGGESGLGGVTVQLMSGTTVVATTITALDGSYTFTGVAPGTYDIREVQPSGYESTTPDTLGSVTVPSTGRSGQNFGERLPGAGTGAAWVAGQVFVDRDGDGTVDIDEPGVAGVTVTLQDGFGTPVATTTTDAAGRYRFENLAPGTYRLSQTQPVGMGSTTPNLLDPVVVPLEGLDAQNFGESFGSLSGSVYVDSANPGVRDSGESGIAGVTITLTGTDAAANAVNRTTTTDLDGNWTFGDLRAGTYTVAETQPAAYPDGVDVAGSAGGSVSNDAVGSIAFGAASNATGYLFGEGGRTITTPAGTSWVSGVVFADRDRDSNIDPGERPLAGVLVQLRDSSNVIVGSTLTGPDGRYIFSGLVPGATYTVTEVDPVGYGSSLNPTAASFTAAADGAGAIGPDFGDILSQLEGSVYHDVNRNGVRDAGEPGIGATRIVLSGTDADGTAVTATTYTAGDGSYRFNDLLGGTYTITETQPWGHRDGAESQGSIASDTSTDDVHGAINLGNGVIGTGFDFGEERVATIASALSGRVFHDRGTDGATANGTFESGEPGVGGVTVVLRDVNNVVVASTVTAADGTYSFGQIPPGTYSVEMLQPTGYGTSTPVLRSTLIVPISGLDNVDFGVTLASVRGVVFSDVDDDGVRDSGEAGIAGVAIALTGTDAFGNAVTRSATTDSDGRFVIIDLMASGPAGYMVTEVQPTRWLDGLDRSPLAGVAGDDQFAGVAVSAGSAVDVGTFGEVAGARIGNRIWNDANANGIQDSGEAGIAGIVVKLGGTPDRAGLPPVSRSTTTAADGSYEFNDVRPGTYRIEVEMGDYLPTYTGVGTDRGTDSDIGADGRTTEVRISANTTITSTAADRLDLDGGLAKGAYIRGRLFRDTDGSGSRGTGEGAGTCDEVRLTPAGPDRTLGSGDDQKPLVAKPGPDGTYSFGPVLPGKYRVGSDCTESVEVEVGGEQVLNDADLALPVQTDPSRLAFTGGTAATFVAMGLLLTGAGVAILGGKRLRRR